MSLQKPSAQTELLLVTLLEQIHATLKETLKQQNDRIARLEAQQDGATLAITDDPEDTRNTGLDTLDHDPVSNDQAPEAAPFNADDYPMIMSIWPDPSQAIQTNIASELGQEQCKYGSHDD
jgi:hypothetical protein